MPILFEYDGKKPLEEVFASSYNLLPRMQRGQLKLADGWIEAYQKPPPKEDDERRSMINLGTFGVKELYFSFKIKPTELTFNPTPSNDPWAGGFNMSEWALNWGPEANRKWFYWGIKSRFSVTREKRLRASLGANKMGDGPWFNSTHRDVFGANPRDNPETWGNTPLASLGPEIRCMHYVKFDGNNSSSKAWINDTLIQDLSGLPLDPTVYPEWNNNPYGNGRCAFLDGQVAYPMLEFGLYQSQESFENRVFFKDVVVSTDYIPSSYEVGGIPPFEPPVIVPATRTLVAQALPFPLILAKLWTLRKRFIREYIHRKVHPWI